MAEKRTSKADYFHDLLEMSRKENEFLREEIEYLRMANLRTQELFAEMRDAPSTQPAPPPPTPRPQHPTPPPVPYPQPSGPMRGELTKEHMAEKLAQMEKQAAEEAALAAIPKRNFSIYDEPEEAPTPEEGQRRAVEANQRLEAKRRADAVPVVDTQRVGFSLGSKLGEQ